MFRICWIANNNCPGQGLSAPCPCQHCTLPGPRHILIGILKLLFAICFCIPSYAHQQLLSLDYQNFVHYNSLVFFYLSWELSWCRFSLLKGDLQFSKIFKNTICIGLCKLKCTEKRFIPFNPLHFLPYFVPHTENKGRPEYATWMYSNINLLEIMRLAFSLQVPSILSILLGETLSLLPL